MEIIEIHWKTGKRPGIVDLGLQSSCREISIIKSISACRSEKGHEVIVQLIEIIKNKSEYFKSDKKLIVGTYFRNEVNTLKEFLPVLLLIMKKATPFGQTKL